MEPGPTFPFMGLSRKGVAVFWASTLGPLFAIMGAPSVVASFGLDTRHAAGASVLVILGCVGGVYASVICCRIGAPRPRDTPSQLWEKQRWGVLR